MQQSDVWPSDNQIHISHWNLVHVIPGEHLTYKIFDHFLYMNDIPSRTLENIQIHAVHASKHPEDYVPEDFTRKVQNISDVTLSDTMKINYRFLAHCPRQIDREFSAWYCTGITNTVKRLDGHELFTVFDFLHQLSQNIQLDNQLHISHWNLGHVSAFEYPLGEQIYKIFYHHFEIKNIPNRILQNIQAHAINVTQHSQYYLRNLISKKDPCYLCQAACSYQKQHCTQKPSTAQNLLETMHTTRPNKADMVGLIAQD